MCYDIFFLMFVKVVVVVFDLDKMFGGLLFELKWDGFCGFIVWDGEMVEIGFCGVKFFMCYFLELVEVIFEVLFGFCLFDGEIVVVIGLQGVQ